MIFNRFIVFLP